MIKTVGICSESGEYIYLQYILWCYSSPHYWCQQYHLHRYRRSRRQRHRTIIYSVDYYCFNDHLTDGGKKALEWKKKSISYKNQESICSIGKCLVWPRTSGLCRCFQSKCIQWMVGDLNITRLHPPLGSSVWIKNTSCKWTKKSHGPLSFISANVSSLDGQAAWLERLTIAIIYDNLINMSHTIAGC